MVSQSLYSILAVALFVVSAQAGDSIRHDGIAARNAHHRRIAEEFHGSDEEGLDKRQWWKDLIPKIPINLPTLTLPSNLPSLPTSVPSTGGVPNIPTIPVGDCRKQFIPPAPGVTGASTCLKTVRTDDIDNPTTGLQLGTINNWAGGRIPEQLRGIFYLAGDPYAAECFSHGTATYNASQGSLDVHLYRPRTWSSDEGSNQLAYNTGFGLMFQSICYAVATNNGRIHCDTWQYHYLDNTQNYRGDYTVDEIGDGHFLRGSSVRGVKGVDTTVVVPGTNMSSSRYYYNMYKIVDGNGKRTHWFNDVYLANIGRKIGVDGQPYIHLNATQEVPQ